MEIQHASMAQVRMGVNGRSLLVTEDMFDVAKEIKEIDPALSVHWNEFQDFYTVVETLPDGREKLVTTAQTLDRRLANHVRSLNPQHYDLVKELDRLDAKADKAKSDKFNDDVGEHGERLAHALRKDKQIQTHIYVPKNVTGD